MSKTTKAKPVFTGRSIVSEINIYLILAIALVQIIAFFTIYNFRSTEMKENYEELASTYTEQLTKSLSLPIWSFDSEQIEIIGSIYMNSGLLQMINVEDESGEVLFNSEDLEKKGMIFTQADILRGEKVIGHLELAIGSDEYLRRLDQFMRDTRFIIILSLLITFIISTIALRHVIQSSISVFEKKMDNVASGKFDIKTDEDAPRKELKGIAKRFNTMVENIQDREKALNELNENQDKIIQSRTQELLEKTNEANTANQIKSSFLANMSHEIRTPMNGVLGMTELLMNTPLTEHQHEFVKAIKSSGDSLLKIINDILDFSKIEAGMIILDRIDFNIRSIISNTLDVVRTKAETKGIALIADVDHGIPEQLIGDPGKLRQVILNIVSNAIKFTKNGKVELQIYSVESNDENTLKLHFSVIDTGIGIPEERIEKVFQSFTQADGSTSRKYGGSGLGLTISEQLINLMDGKIWVESTLNKGSIFHFEVNFDINTEQPELCDKVYVNKIKDSSILILDSIEITRIKLEKFVEDWGCKKVSIDNPRMIDKLVADNHHFEYAIFHGNDISMPQDSFFTSVIDKLKIPRENILFLLPDLIKNFETVFSQYLNLSYTPIESYTLLSTLVNKEASSGGINKISESDIIFSKNSKALKILLVEDNRINQMVACEMLAKLGHVINTASSGERALEIWDTDEFDIVLMDIQMPNMDGITATALLREKMTNREVPIIAMTAHAMKGDKDRFIKEGMDNYISKPIYLESLFNVLESYCGTNKIIKMKETINMEWEKIIKRFFDDKDFVIQIVQTFLDQLPDQTERFEKAITAEDFTEISDSAHTIKGAVGNFQTGACFEAAQALEMAGRNKESIKEIHSMAAVLREELQKITAEFHSFLEDNPETSA